MRTTLPFLSLTVRLTRRCANIPLARGAEVCAGAGSLTGGHSANAGFQEQSLIILIRCAFGQRACGSQTCRRDARKKQRPLLLWGGPFSFSAAPIFLGGSPISSGGSPFWQKRAPFFYGVAPISSERPPFLQKHAPFSSGGRPFFCGVAPYFSGIAPFFQRTAPFLRRAVPFLFSSFIEAQNSHPSALHRYALTSMGRHQSPHRLPLHLGRSQPVFRRGRQRLRTRAR